jgi:hypothetical protein
MKKAHIPTPTPISDAMAAKLEEIEEEGEIPESSGLDADPADLSLSTPPDAVKEQDIGPLGGKNDVMEEERDRDRDRDRDGDTSMMSGDTTTPEAEPRADVMNAETVTVHV